MSLSRSQQWNRQKKGMKMAWMHTAKKTTLPNKLYTGYHETTEEEGN